MAQRRTRATAEEAPQPDPAAPIDSKRLLKHLTRLLKLLEHDLLARADGSAGLTEALKARHAQEVAAERTADGYDAWRRGVVTQVAAAWVLNVVFVRVLEDRGLVEHKRIAGPGALASERQFLELAPYLTERDYLLTVFRELSHFEVTRELFDPKKNLAFRITPSAEGAKQLLAVFRLGSADAPAFRFGQSSTRFLGDLYQDLSEDVRKKYALLQTPDFIEAFILDRTLEPALETYGLDATTLIDPTCGSGHFLLGAFERLFDRQQKEHPNRNERDAALAALAAVYGTDINPYAVSIAKFRLVLAFLEKAGFTKLAAAPAVPLNVVTADSLYHQVAVEHAGQGDLGYQPGQKTRDWFGEAFALEEDEKAKAILGRGFGAVVGNPPYITVKDKAQNEAYRRRYRSCHRSYSLAAPFAERFFQLCRAGGYTGMITANSFMKRDFGKVLIEKILPNVDLQLVVNASGAYIPGHGTPTVLLFGQNQAPDRSVVRVVLAKRGEPSTPRCPEKGFVWASIAGHFNEAGFENEFISVANTQRDVLAHHPWSLGGGGAAELKVLLERHSTSTLGEVAEIGTGAVTREDEVYNLNAAILDRHSIPAKYRRGFVLGEHVRDWSLSGVGDALWPYTADTLDPVSGVPEIERFLWPWKTQLKRRVAFGKTQQERGLPWTAYSMFFSKRARTPLTVTFAFVATHNHFVLDRGGRVFNRTAPIIKLPETATEDDHYALLAYLNSSTACFWMKQVFYPKATSVGDVSTEKGRPEANRYEFAGTGLGNLPLPPWAPEDRQRAVEVSRRLCALGEERSELTPKALLAGRLRRSLSELESRRQAIRAEMVVLQEDLDWLVYKAWGLVSEYHPSGPIERVPVRPFERSRSVWPGWEARRSKIEESPELGLLEDPMFKRLWLGRQGVFGHGSLTVEDETRMAVAEHVQDAVELLLREPVTRSAASLLMDVVGRVQRALEAVTELTDVEAHVRNVLQEPECMPYLAVMRFTPAGFEKHREWLKTWELQRQEDSGETVGAVPVPPKYKPEDFRDSSYWSLRGKLDVPKERFISYPGCESDDDKSPVYGWAGWNHLQRAQALAGLYQARKDEGWEAARLLPMLVGLIELLPWLHQYHGEPDESLGGDRPADQFEAFVAEELRLAGKAREQAEREVLAWARQRGGGAQRKARPARPERDAARESDTDADESTLDLEPESAAPSSRAALKPPSKAKARSKSKPANDIDVDEARPAAQANRRGRKGGSR